MRPGLIVDGHDGITSELMEMIPSCGCGFGPRRLTGSGSPNGNNGGGNDDGMAIHGFISFPFDGTPSVSVLTRDRGANGQISRRSVPVLVEFRRNAVSLGGFRGPVSMERETWVSDRTDGEKECHDVAISNSFIKSVQERTEFL